MTAIKLTQADIDAIANAVAKRVFSAKLAEEKDFLTPAEAAQFLQRPLSAIYKMTSAKILPYYKAGGLRFRRTELEDWARSRRVITNKELDRQTDTEAALYCMNKKLHRD